ncbi:MAG: DNA adenine methylase [Planctomycetota bacterium]
MIKYLGSKRALLGPIVDLVGSLPGATSVVDLFSGTSRVGHALKALGYRVHANDDAAYAELLARCYVVADRERWLAPAQRLLAELSDLAGEPGYFTRTFCEESRFFRPHNGARVDRVRREIAERGLHPELEAIALTSLVEAADRVDSTTGVHMAYLKSWAPRSSRDLELRMPDLLPRAEHGPGTASRLDALDAAKRFEADVAYLDPPYNQHKYVGNYHIWETLVLGDEPEAYGVARKRADCRERRSPFNSRARCEDALRAVVTAVRARYVVLSFSDEGFVTLARLASLLSEHGRVGARAIEHRRYVGARIGIHGPRGERVGTVSHVRNREYLFLLAKDGAEWPERGGMEPLECVLGRAVRT